jgi:hypothetical protein
LYGILFKDFPRENKLKMTQNTSSQRYLLMDEDAVPYVGRTDLQQLRKHRDFAKLQASP